MVMDRQKIVLLIVILFFLLITLLLGGYTIYGVWPNITHTIIATVLSSTLCALLSLLAIYVSKFPIVTRPKFHRQAAKIYAKASETDDCFAITDTFALPKVYGKAYKNCKARKFHFFGQIRPNDANVLGVLARIAIFEEHKFKGDFILKDIPHSMIHEMPPKLAGSTKEIVFGQKLLKGETEYGHHVANEVLSKFLWQYIQKHSAKWQTADSIIAAHLEKNGISKDPKDPLTHKQFENIIYEKFAPLALIYEHWGKKRSKEIIPLAITGLRHIIENHCS